MSRSTRPKGLNPRWWTALSISVLALACCSHFEDEPDYASGVARLSILIYSGRADPVVFLGEGSWADSIRERIVGQEATELPVARLSPRENVLGTRSGYRGLILENLDLTLDLPAFLAVYDGWIQAGTDSPAFFPDDGRELERSLLREAIARGILAGSVADYLRESQVE